MPRIRLALSYEGTRYSGWQRQTTTGLTVQGVVEECLARVVNARVNLVPSGRTDAGVHARIQVTHADIPEAAMRYLEPAQPGSATFCEPRLKHALNRMLPQDVRVLSVDLADPAFHAIRDVRRKTYVYFIDTAPVQLPELRRYTWHLRLPLNWPAIAKATESLRGTHDFKAFCGKGSQVKTTTRTIYEAWWGPHRWTGLAGSTELSVFRVTGSGFLKHMVRSIVGTLVQIGNGKCPPDRIAELVETGARTKIGPTAPPQGLWLWDVAYKPLKSRS